MADIGALIVRIGADASDLQKEFNKMSKSGKDFGDQLQHAGKIAAIGLAAVGAVAAATATGIFALTKATANTGDEFAKMSKRTGESVETLSELSYVAKLADADAQSLQKAYKTLSTNAFEASQGSREQAEAFRLLHVSVTDTNGALKPGTQLMLEVGDRLAQLKNTTEQAALGTRIFGKQWQDLAPLLLQGSGAIRQQMEEAKLLGVVWSTDAAAAAEEFNDNLTRMGSVIEGLRNIIGQAFMPVINDMVVGILEWYKANAKIIQQDVKAWAKAAGEQIVWLSNVLLDFITTMKSLAGGPVGSLFKMELQGWASIFTLLSHAIRETTAEVDTFLRTMGKSDSVKKFWNDALAAGKKALDAETRQKLETIFNPGAMFKSAPPSPPAAPPPAAGGGSAGLGLAGMKERNTRFGLAMEQQMAGEAAMFSKVDTKAFDTLLFKVDQLRKLMPELNFQEAAEQIRVNEEIAAAAIQDATEQYKDRNKALEIQAEKYQGLATLQAEYYQSDILGLDKANAARRVAFGLIDAEYELRRASIDQQIFDEERKSAAITRLDNELEAKRMATIRQYPTFVEQQLQTIVDSNVFSVGSIVSTWTNGIAQVIVKGGNLKAAWEATQVAILQSGLNTLVQWGAASALAYLRETALGEAVAGAKEALFARELSGHEAMEAAKTAVTKAGEAARVALGVGANAAFAASVTATFATISGVGGAVLAILAVIVNTVAGVMYALATAAALIPGGQEMAGALATGATALEIGGNAAVAAGTVGLAAAVAAGTKAAMVSIPALAEGGIVTGPTLALIGEAGPEAVIPLSGRNAGGMGQEIIIHNHLHADGREFARVTTRYLPRAMRMEGAPA